MRRFLLGLTVVISIVAVTLVGCHDSSGRAEQRAEKQAAEKAAARESRLEYFADFRPDGGPICFAYRQGTYAAALATVDCDKVRNMLPAPVAERIP